jgi:hypothetical protein
VFVVGGDWPKEDDHEGRGEVGMERVSRAVVVVELGWTAGLRAWELR